MLRIGGYPLRKYGSQGQQKSFLIALKLAQYTIVAQEKGEKPILLLDDLFDKLDAGRVEQLIRLVSEDSFGQIVITDCNPTRLRRILDKAGGAYSSSRSKTAASGRRPQRPERRLAAGSFRPKRARRKQRTERGMPGRRRLGLRKKSGRQRCKAKLRRIYATQRPQAKIRRTGRLRNRYGRHGIRRKGGSAMRRTKTMLMGDLLEEFSNAPMSRPK
ncbi:MAG: hypothetical protein ACLRMJ_10055 [Alistipes finegoldii]